MKEEKTEKELGCPMCSIFGWLFNLIKKPFEILCGKNGTDSDKSSCSTSCSTKK
jgi:hypothetical protein